MTKQIPEIPYGKLLIPEHLALINKSATQKVCVPTFLTTSDLAELLAQKSLDDITSDIQPVDHTKMPIDDRIKDAFSKPDKIASSIRSKNALTIAFSLLGYASNLGRRIDVIASSVDADGQMTRNGRGFSSQISPELFDAFQSSALEGAQALFGEAASRMGYPERMVVMAFISPSADVAP